MHLRKLNQKDVVAELAFACLEVLDSRTVFTTASRGEYTARRDLEKVRTGLQSSGKGPRALGIEFFRVAHERWLMNSKLIKPNQTNLSDQLAEAWAVFQEWALLILSPHSELNGLRAMCEFQDAFARLTVEQQKWVGDNPRQPLTALELDEAEHALLDLRELISHIQECLAEHDESIVLTGLPLLDLDPDGEQVIDLVSVGV